MDNRPANIIIVSFLGFASIIVGGVLFLTYTGRDITVIVATLLPFVGTVAGMIGISANQRKVESKVDTISGQVNGKLDAKLDALHEHLTNAGVADPRSAPYTEPVGESATGIDESDGPND